MHIWRSILPVAPTIAAFAVSLAAAIRTVPAVADNDAVPEERHLDLPVVHDRWERADRSP